MARPSKPFFRKQTGKPSLLAHREESGFPTQAGTQSGPLDFFSTMSTSKCRVFPMLYRSLPSIVPMKLA